MSIFGNTQLTLLGVVHRDPDGPDLLWRFLESQRPQGVSIELSRHSLTYRRSNRERLLTLLEANLEALAAEPGQERAVLEASGHAQAVRRALEIPYEYEVASAYCRRRNASVELVDLSRVSRDLLPDLDELVSVDNLRTMFSTPSTDARMEAERQRRQARKLMVDGPLDPSAWPREPDAETSARETHMSQQISKRLRPGRIQEWVHVGGWEHMLWVQDRTSLYTLLSEFQPRRVIL